MIVTKGLGGKQLLLFGLGETSGEFVFTASADCLQARQVCETLGAFIAQPVYGGGFAYYIRPKKVFKAKCDARQKKQLCDAEGRIVFTALTDCIQKKQICKSEGRLIFSALADNAQTKNRIKAECNIIAISDDEIMTLLMAA